MDRHDQIGLTAEFSKYISENKIKQWIANLKGTYFLIIISLLVAYKIKYQYYGQTRSNWSDSSVQ